MAQEKISFNPAFMSLPLQADPARLARCDCRDDSRQAWDDHNRVLIQIPERWQPGLFFIRKASPDSAKFILRIYRASDGALVKTLPSAQLLVQTYRHGNGTNGTPEWDTVALQAGENLNVDLLGGVYYLTVAGLRSEPFRIVANPANDGTPPRDSLNFALSNPANLAEVPYQTGYTQVFGLPGMLCADEPRTYTETDKSERYGDKTTYFRQYRVWSVSWVDVSLPLAELLKSLETHALVKIGLPGRTIELPGSRISVSVKEDSCCTQSVTLSLEETITEWGTCAADAALTAVDGLASADGTYIDPADNDPTADPYTPTSPDAVPPPASNPADGAVLSTATETRSCSDAFVDQGLSYQKKTVIVRADGHGGQRTETLYTDLCELSTGPVLTPVISGVFGDIFSRVGQALHQFLLDPARFQPAFGSSQPPTVTVTGLPAGITYAGGYLSGTPTTEGVLTANVVVSQPGGASVKLPLSISTAPAAATLLDTNLVLTTQYDAVTQQLLLTVTAPVRPELSVRVGAFTANYQPAMTGETADEWKLGIDNVPPGSGRVSIRQTGSTNTGIDVPIVLSAASAGDGNRLGQFPVQVTSPADGQTLSFFTLPNGQIVLINAAKPTLDGLTADKDFTTDSTDAIDGVAMLKRLPSGKWEIVRNGYGNVGDALFNRLTPAQLTSIYYGLNNEGRLYLANLLKLGGPEFTDNFYISGDNNTIYIHRPGDPRTPRGMAFIDRSVDAQGITRNDVTARMGLTPEGYLESFVAGKRTVEFRSDKTVVNTPDLQGNFDLTARSLNVSETPLADSFAMLPGLFYNETFKTWQMRYMTPKDYAAYLLSLPAFAQLQAAVVAPGATIIDHRILCHTVTVPAPTSQKITLTAAVDGQTFSHLLETDQLEYDVFAKTGSGAYKRDTSVSIGDITSTTFKLISPFPAFDGYIRIGNATL